MTRSHQDPPQLLTALTLLVVELAFLGYPKRLLQRALSIKLRQTDQHVWRDAAPLLLRVLAKAVPLLCPPTPA